MTGIGDLSYRCTHPYALSLQHRAGSAKRILIYRDRTVTARVVAGTKNSILVTATVASSTRTDMYLLIENVAP